jgi:hypothetical protein
LVPEKAMLLYSVGSLATILLQRWK